MTSSPPLFWRAPAEEQLAALGSQRTGLTSAEARRRLERDGPNRVPPPPRRRVIFKIGRRLIEPLIAILLIAAAVSAAMGDFASFAIILTMVFLSIGLDVFQEQRAERAAETLRRAIAVKAKAWRDGAVVMTPVEALVPGDVVELIAGDLVPADGIVLSSAGANANEALLTGEAYPVEKRPGPSGAMAPAEAFDALFSGTSLVGGRAEMLVVATGAATRLGGIAAALDAAEPPTAFERGLHALGALILRLTIFLVLFVLLARLAFHRPALESFMFAVALAVGLTPELLPMVTTVTLSRGALRLASRRVIVKRLAAIHDLGAMQVLCTDKTGTLTEAKIALAASLNSDGAESARVLELAALNSRLMTDKASSLDDAIVAASSALDLSGWVRRAEAPFDFERRRASILAEHGGSRRLIVKGAPEELLARCVRLERDDGSLAQLDAESRRKLTALHDAEAGKGRRLLGVAWRDLESDRISPTDERDLTFAGLCAFVDPPKPSASAAVARLGAQGVRVKIISGDAAPVVLHLVETLGLPAKGLLTGAEIEAMSDQTLAARAMDVDLFARVVPDQKSRIIRALRARGVTVGFLGDGVNDAPAIKAADCGLSVDTASDVARAAADLILLAPDLGVVADGVVEGRRTYANIIKYIRMGTSSNFGNMLSMALASVVIPFLPMTAVQILLNNLLYDFSEIGIPLDSVDHAEVQTPQSWDMRAILRFTVIIGPLSSVFDISTYAILLGLFHATPAEFQTAWFLESLATQTLVIFLIRTRGPPWRSRPHPALAATSISAVAVGIFLALGPFARLFGFAPLPRSLLLSIAALVVVYLACAEGLKRIAMRLNFPSEAHPRRLRWH